jgi:hypothetical protein
MGRTTAAKPRRTETAAEQQRRAEPVKCADCGRAIRGHRVTFGRRSASGVLAQVSLCGPCNAELNARVYEQAVADGRHAATTYEVCGGCGSRVAALHHVRLDGVYVCQGCAVDVCKCPICAAERERREKGANGPA